MCTGRMATAVIVAIHLFMNPHPLNLVWFLNPVVVSVPP